MDICYDRYYIILQDYSENPDRSVCGYCKVTASTVSFYIKGIKEGKIRGFVWHGNKRIKTMEFDFSVVDGKEDYLFKIKDIKLVKNMKIRCSIFDENRLVVSGQNYCEDPM
jgi:hypothetical protein